ncbi:MAG: hypothetical protein JF615_00695 [Asticcacaulis sp.]|nr:hypothetical protein [Asticcacaulis sp.]
MVLKYLIPFDRVTIDSPLSLQEARSRLAASLEPKQFRFFYSGTKELEGTMTPHGFRVSRILRGRNSFNAQAIGEIDPAPRGSRIRVHLRMPIFVIIFCLAWMSFPLGLVAVINGRFLEPLHDSTFQPAALLPLGMVAFMVLITNLGFWSSATKLKSDLRRIFQAGA